MRSLYLAVDLMAVAIPLAFSWHPRIRFNEKWRAFWPACLVVAVLFLAWDVVFTANGIWGFDSRYLLGVSLAGLPVEEWLFFICIPYACVFTYHAVGIARLPDAVALSRIVLVAILVLSVFLLPVSIGQWYSISVASGTATLALYLLWKQPAWLSRFLAGFVLILPPFIATNGVLTGVRFWEAPTWNANPDAIIDHVVWYDNIHNLGVRMFTIPVEDVLYAFMLIGLNVILFERFDERSRTDT